MNKDPTLPLTQPNFDGVPVESLEQLRMRLAQLNHSLNKLQTDMSQSITLPQWSSLQNQIGVILSQLTSLSTTLDKHLEKLSRTDVYPLNTFPTSQQEGLLTTLLRKKHLPEITSWINESLALLDQMSLSQDDKWCGWCLSKIEQEIENFIFSGFLTKDELSNKDEDVVVSVDDAGLDVNQVYKFIYQGIDPK